MPLCTRALLSNGKPMVHHAEVAAPTAAMWHSIVTDLGVHIELLSSDLLLCKDHRVGALWHILCTQVQQRLTAGCATTGAGWVEGLHSHPRWHAKGLAATQSVVLHA